MMISQLAGTGAAEPGHQCLETTCGRGGADTGATPTELMIAALAARRRLTLHGAQFAAAAARSHSHA